MTPPNDTRPVRPSVPGPLELWKRQRDDDGELDEYDPDELERLARWHPSTPYNPHFPGGLFE